MKGDNIMGTIVNIVLGLVVIGFVGGVGVLALAEFEATLTGNSSAQTTVSNLTESILNLAKQLPVFGTIAGVSAILLLILGIVFWVQRKGERLY